MSEPKKQVEAGPFKQSEGPQWYMSRVNKKLILIEIRDYDNKGIVIYSSHMTMPLPENTEDPGGGALSPTTPHSLFSKRPPLPNISSNFLHTVRN